MYKIFKITLLLAILSLFAACSNEKVYNGPLEKYTGHILVRSVSINSTHSGMYKVILYNPKEKTGTIEICGNYKQVRVYKIELKDYHLGDTIR